MVKRRPVLRLLRTFGLARACSPGFGDFWSGGAPVLRVSGTFCPRARAPPPDFGASNVAVAAGSQRNLDALVEYCRKTSHLGKPLIEHPTVRHRLSECAIEIQVARMLSYRVLSLQDRGGVPNMEASLAKLSILTHQPIAVRASISSATAVANE